MHSDRLRPRTPTPCDRSVRQGAAGVATFAKREADDERKRMGSAPWTVAERKQAEMLYLLSEGSDSGWTLWEDHRRDRELEPGAFGPFKSTLIGLEREGYVVKTGKFDNSVKKGKHWGTAVWAITDSGQRRLAELNSQLRRWSQERDKAEEAGEPTTADSFIRKRITSKKPVPIEVWRELMRRQKAGELDVVFIRRADEE